MDHTEAFQIAEEWINGARTHAELDTEYHVQLAIANNLEAIKWLLYAKSLEPVFLERD